MCGKEYSSFYNHKTFLARDLSSGDRKIYIEYECRRIKFEICDVMRCHLDFLAANKKFTKCFALSIDSLCRTNPIKEDTKWIGLDLHTVKELEKDYMRVQLALADPPALKDIGIDEISIKKAT